MCKLFSGLDSSRIPTVTIRNDDNDQCAAEMLRSSRILTVTLSMTIATALMTNDNPRNDQ